MQRGYGSTPSRLFLTRSLSASLVEAKASSRCWESEAQEAVERVVQAEVERDVTRHEASMAKLDTETAGSAQA